MTRRPSERGFTLIELMTATLAGGFLVLAITTTIVGQQAAFTAQSDLVDAQQNARAALGILEHEVRQAGWGFVQGTVAGVPPIGHCYIGSATTNACNNVSGDGDSDRLRIYYMKPGPTFSSGDTTGGTSGGGANLAAPAYIDTADEQMANNTPILVSGTCDADNITKAELATVQSFSASNYTLTSALADCGGGYRAGYTFGEAVVRDFYIDRDTEPGHPRLMMDPDGLHNPAEVPQVVAYDIEDLQVTYLLDTGTDADGATAAFDGVDATPDLIAETTCSQGIRLEGGVDECNLSPRMADTRTNQSRIMAVTLEVVARTRFPDDARTAGDDADVTVGDHTILGDKYRRRVYRSTIALRSLSP